MSRPLSAVVAGHICLDIIPDMGALPQGQFTSLFQPGQMIQVGQAIFSTGGPVSNTGLALHILGIPTQLMGKVGDDLFGQAILEIVRSYGEHLAAGMLVDPAASTSYTVIINPPGVDRFFLHNPGANDTFSAQDVRYEGVVGADLFHFGYPPVMRRMYSEGGAELAEIFRRARSTGATTSLDMCFPDPSSPGGQVDWGTIYRRVLPHADLFLPSIEELLFTLHREIYDRLRQAAGGVDFLPWITPQLLNDISSELLDLGVKVVVLKLGERGAYLRTAGPSALQEMGRARPPDLSAWADQELWAPCFQARVVGTTGSGDATIAGFLGGLLRGLSPRQSLTAAVAVGACNVEAADALSGLRSWGATQQRINGGWPRHAFSLSAPGWRWDPEDSLWSRRSGQG